MCGESLEIWSRFYRTVLYGGGEGVSEFFPHVLLVA